MLSVVGESAQVALQASAMTGKDGKTEKSSKESGGKGRRDTVTLSPEAVQMTHAALSATDKPHDHPQEKPQEKTQDDSAEEGQESRQP